MPGSDTNPGVRPVKGISRSGCTKSLLGMSKIAVNDPSSRGVKNTSISLGSPGGIENEVSGASVVKTPVSSFVISIRPTSESKVSPRAVMVKTTLPTSPIATSPKFHDSGSTSIFCAGAVLLNASNVAIAIDQKIFHFFIIPFLPLPVAASQPYTARQLLTGPSNSLKGIYFHTKAGLPPVQRSPRCHAVYSG